MEKHGESILRECKSLKDRQAYNEAIALIEKNIDRIEPEIRDRAWREASALARQNGDSDQAERFTRLVREAEAASDALAKKLDALELQLLPVEDYQPKAVAAEEPKAPEVGQGEDIIETSGRLRSKELYNEAIELIQKSIHQIHPDLHVRAWYEAFYAARAKGDTELAKRFVISIANAGTSEN